MTKRVVVSVRFLATALYAGLACWFLDSWLPSLQIFGVDALMAAYPWLAILITCFAVAGVANAFNIIDGYNGLSAMVGVIILGGVAYVAFQLADFHIMIAALALMGALLGFLVWNYPRGLIFLGDGGAYFVGFWIAELSVLLTARHPEVSAWAPMLVCGYPLLEVGFSIYRRKKRNLDPGQPDRLHLHSLVKRRLVRPLLPGTSNLLRNSATGAVMWIAAALPVLIAVQFPTNTAYLAIGFLFCGFAYSAVYARLTQFKWCVEAATLRGRETARA